MVDGGNNSEPGSLPEDHDPNNLIGTLETAFFGDDTLNSR